MAGIAPYLYQGILYTDPKMKIFFKTRFIIRGRMAVRIGGMGNGFTE